MLTASKYVAIFSKVSDISLDFEISTVDEMPEIFYAKYKQISVFIINYVIYSAVYTKRLWTVKKDLRESNYIIQVFIWILPLN